MRFLSQVTTDNICLTGMKFFSVTRGLVLTVCIYIYRCNIYMLIQSEMFNLQINYYISGSRNHSYIRISSSPV